MISEILGFNLIPMHFIPLDSHLNFNEGNKLRKQAEDVGMASLPYGI